MKRQVVTLLREGQFSENFLLPCDMKLDGKTFNKIGVNPSRDEFKASVNLVTFIYGEQAVELLQTHEDALSFIKTICMINNIDNPGIINERVSIRQQL